MDKWRSYCSGIGICLILIAVIGICALHDQIYMWSLGGYFRQISAGHECL